MAAIFRIAPIRSGLPYSDYIDEGHVLHQTIDAFNRRSLDVYWYGLPALTAYSTGGALLLYNPAYRHFHGHDFKEDLPHERGLPSSKFNYDFIAPVELIVAGRSVTACLSIATVILAGVVAARLADNKVGILTMLLVALCPALVTRSSIVIVDTFATFFALLSIYYSLRILSANKDSWRSALFAGVAVGLTFASKYPASAVGAAVMTNIFFLQVDPWRRLKLILLSGGGVFLGILVGAPMTFFQPAKVLRDILGNIRDYETIHSAVGYFAQAISTLELGWPLFLAGCAGMILLLRERHTRNVALGWIIFGATLIVLFAGKSFRPFRSFLPLVPLLCIAAAMALTRLLRWARSGPHTWLRYGVTVALIVACVGSLGFSSYRQVERRMSHRDSRVQAVDWLQQNTEKQQRVLAIKELAVLPSEWARIDAQITVVPYLEAAARLQDQSFDFVVSGEPELSTDEHLQFYRETWLRDVSSFKVLAEFGRVTMPLPLNFWRTNDERVVIYRIK